MNLGHKLGIRIGSWVIGSVPRVNGSRYMGFTGYSAQHQVATWALLGTVASGSDKTSNRWCAPPVAVISGEIEASPASNHETKHLDTIKTKIYR